MRKKRNLFFILLILCVAIIIPTTLLSLASMKMYNHPTVFFWNGQPVGPISIFAFMFIALELIFNSLWCPFRRWTVSSCRATHCSLSKICKNCEVRLSLHATSPVSDQERDQGKYYFSVCENCEILVVGAISLMSLLGLIIWETILLNG